MMTRHLNDLGPHTCRHRRVSVSLTIATALFASISFGLGSASAADDPGEPPVSRKLVHAMRDLPYGLSIPLYPLGDVDENGRVDAMDRHLIHVLAQAGENEWSRFPDVSCPGAGDLNIDGTVDEHDAAIADDWVAEAPLATPALFFQAALPCRFERLTVAVELALLSGDETPLYLLREDSGYSNTTVTVDTGPATVREGDDDRVYLIDVDADAKTGDTVVLGIRFGDDEAYLLSLPVQAIADIDLEGS